MAKPRRMKRVSQLAHELTQRGWVNVPSSRKLYFLAIDSKFEAEPINNIWHFDEGRIDAIAEAIGLTKADTRIAA
jgi:hypothetical protein